MTISHGGYAFESITSHEVPLEGNYDHAPLVFSFFGVPGSTEIRDTLHGREIRLVAQFRGYATKALLQAALKTVDGKVGTLNDATLTVNDGVSTLTYYHCTFRGFERTGTASADLNGGTEWIQDGVLVWWQLRRTQ